MSYEIGQKVRVTVKVTDPGGAPVDDAATALSLTSPAGVTTTPTPVTHDGAAGSGLYHVDTTPTAAGDWVWTWNAPGAGYVATGQYNVRAAGQRIVSLTEAKAYLNKSQAVTADDDEVRAFVDAAQIVVEGVVGPVVVGPPILERYDGGCRKIVLRLRPVAQVVSITEYQGGAPFTLVPESGGGSYLDYLLWPGPGILIRRQYHQDAWFAWGCDNIEVTYAPGRNPVPANIRLAAMDCVGYLWRNSQLLRGDQRAAASAEQVYGSIGTEPIPLSVLELLGPTRRGPRLG